MSLMLKPWITTGAVFLIYGIGAVSGWFSNQLVRHPKPDQQQLPTINLDPNSPFEEMLDSQLQLSADQKTKIHEIMVDASEQARQIRAQIQPQMQKLRTTTMRSIEAQLDPDQQKELNLLRQLNEARRKHMRATGAGGGGGASLNLNYPRNPSNRPGSSDSTNVAPLPIPDPQ